MAATTNFVAAITQLPVIAAKTLIGLVDADTEKQTLPL